MIPNLLHYGLVLGVAVGVTTDLAYSAEATSYQAVSANTGENSLPQDGIYPHGRKLAFMGYSGDPARDLANGFTVEATTTTDQERAKREVEFPSWTSAEFAYRGSRWLFIVNSANVPAAFTVSGWPSGFGGKDAFTGKAMEDQNGSSRQLHLPAYGVAGLRFPLAGPAEQNK